MTPRATAARTKREDGAASLRLLPDSGPKDFEAGARAAAARAARESYGKLLAFLAARSRDVPGPRTRSPTPSLRR